MYWYRLQIKWDYRKNRGIVESSVSYGVRVEALNIEGH
jgi:hypothetical protein